MTDLINIDQAAKRLGLAKQTLYNWATLRRGPKYVRIGRRRLYDPADLQEFIDNRRVDPEKAAQ